MGRSSGVFLAIVLVSTLLGGLVGSAVYALVFDKDEIDRGQLLRLRGAVDGYYDIENTPFCVPLQHFCLVLLEGGEVRALYAYDTHDPSRVRSCEIDWRPDMPFIDPATQEESRGWFRAGCSGTTYRYNGERVFGPGGRDMDQFPVTLKSETVEEPDREAFELQYIEVDTRRLICGEAGPGVPERCERAPWPQ